MIIVNFLSLTKGPLTSDRPQPERFATMEAAVVVVERYAQAAGYTKVRFVEGEDCYDGGRFTATTPGGRAGRNVATIDFE